jgi:hypothetical protein
VELISKFLRQNTAKREDYPELIQLIRKLLNLKMWLARILEWRVKTSGAAPFCQLTILPTDINLLH